MAGKPHHCDGVPTCCTVADLRGARAAAQAMLLMQKAKTYLQEAEVRRQSPNPKLYPTPSRMAAGYACPNSAVNVSATSPDEEQHAHICLCMGVPVHRKTRRRLTSGCGAGAS